MSRPLRGEPRPFSQKFQRNAANLFLLQGYTVSAAARAVDARSYRRLCPMFQLSHQPPFPRVFGALMSEIAIRD
ncbi:MAG: hypothetical protein H8E66_33765 [Planctomycetes bacterium]|nr:hypothetical protein [Planctomycetota bacterium]